MKRRLALAVGASLLCGSLQAETLDYQQAVARALAADPRIAERRHVVAHAEALLQEAQGESDLRFDANTFVAVVSGLDGGFFNAGTTTPRNDRYSFHGLSPWLYLQATVIKPLYTFGKIEHYAAAAKKNIAVKKGDVELQRGDTMVQVAQAYYGYLAARDSRYLLEDVKGRVQGAINMVQKWLDEGTGGAKQSDLYALQAALADVDRYLAQARALEAVALDGLKVLTGIGLDGDLEVADAGLTPLPLPAGKLADLEAEALKDRPEMAQLTAGLAARRELVAATKAEALPDLYAAVAGFVSESPNRARLNNPFISDPFNDMGATPMVGLRWQWESGVQPAHVKQAQADLDALVDKSDYARRGIPFQVAEQYHTVQGDYEAIQALKAGTLAARRWMISSYADFQAGFEEASRVMDAFKGYVLAQTDYLTVLNDYNMHVVQLQYVTGTYP